MNPPPQPNQTQSFHLRIEELRINMAFEIVISDVAWTLRIDTVDGLSVGDQGVTSLWKFLDELNASINGGLDSFKVDRKSDILFSYEFHTKDGRMWKQDLKLDSGASMTFQVSDFWKFEEFAPHRNVRDIVIDLLSTNKINKIKANWA